MKHLNKIFPEVEKRQLSDNFIAQDMGYMKDWLISEISYTPLNFVLWAPFKLQMVYFWLLVTINSKIKFIYLILKEIIITKELRKYKKDKRIHDYEKH